MALNMSAKPLRRSLILSPGAVILKECEVSEDCSLAFLKGPETTQKEAALALRRLALHPGIQVWLHHLVTDGSAKAGVSGVDSRGCGRKTNSV